MEPTLESLLIVSHVIHYQHAGRLYAYGPYAREIDIWADLFPHVAIAAPCRRQSPPNDALAFTRKNISISPQRETGGDTLLAKVRQILLLPVLIWDLCRTMRHHDAIHVRCPGNLGLLGILLAPLFGTYRVAKYAGQWNGHSGERPIVWMQRRILKSRWWGQPVTVYGEWPDQPAHVHGFFTSMMTSEQVERAAATAEHKSIGSPLRVLFCGRLAPEKRIGVLLHAIHITRRAAVPLELAIVGDGPERQTLETQVQQLGLDDQVRFVGALPFDETLQWYQWAHCLVLPSTHSEGWPKVVAEAMCHGVACIAVAHGQIAAMLHGRGYLLTTGSAEEIAEALQEIVERPDECALRMKAAAAWSRGYSLEGLRSALAALLTEQWGVPVACPDTFPEPEPRDEDRPRLVAASRCVQ